MVGYVDMGCSMKKIGFYVPTTHLEVVKSAMFAEGGGRIGHYSHCAWQVLGQGQFMPSEQSNPAIGEPNQLEHVEEYYCTMVCGDDDLVRVIQAMLKSHPYECVAYEVIALENI